MAASKHHSYEFLTAAYAALEAENTALRAKCEALQERLDEVRHANRLDAIERARANHKTELG